MLKYVAERTLQNHRKKKHTQNECAESLVNL